jgi:hypothetical protein
MDQLGAIGLFENPNFSVLMEPGSALVLSSVRNEGIII